MADTIRRKYGVATTVDFELWETDGTDLKTDAAHASGDTTISLNEGNFANTTNGFVDEGSTYSIALTAAEMTAARVVLLIVDQSSKVWLDKVIRIETSHHPSAQHPEGVVAAGTVSSATDETNIVLATSLNVRKGTVIWITSGTGAGGSAIVFSYNSGNGATVLEDPGFPIEPDNTSTFEAYFGPNVTALQLDASDRPVVIMEAIRTADADIEFTGLGVEGDSITAA